jgi:hypothetical protein
MKKWFKHGKEDSAKCNCNPCCKGGAIYGLGFIGSAIYYLQNSVGFGNGVLGILKAIVWPAILVYKLLVFLG